MCWGSQVKQYVAFSGGKDSTALLLRLVEQGEECEAIFTPTGNELPAVLSHIEETSKAAGVEVHVPAGPSLMELIEGYGALPNWRQRWCTRQIKIEPCIEFLRSRPGSVLCVGLRADEEERQGLYGDWAEYRYPLREWGWGLPEVWGYLRDRGVSVPKRTDCALCYGQRLSEWFDLWRSHPEKYAEGVTLEDMTGHTFRSPGRDTWPAGLRELREKFESGELPRGVERQGNLFAEDCDKPETACRVCSF